MNTLYVTKDIAYYKQNLMIQYLKQNSSLAYCRTCNETILWSCPLVICYFTMWTSAKFKHHNVLLFLSGSVYFLFKTSSNSALSVIKSACHWYFCWCCCCCFAIEVCFLLISFANWISNLFSIQKITHSDFKHKYIVWKQCTVDNGSQVSTLFIRKGKGKLLIYWSLKPL